MELLFVGETWAGSNARSLAEGLAQVPGVRIRCLNERETPPRDLGLLRRVARRLWQPLHDRRLESGVRGALRGFPPDVLVVYKGTGIGPDLLTEVRRQGIPVVNVFPDYSPHAYGLRLQSAIGRYDLVISTKHYHEPLWRSLYGYDNKCVYVPHGYDPKLHLWHERAPGDRYDVALCATWRPEYDRLAQALARHMPLGLSVGVAGSGWIKRRRYLPSSWHFPGPLTGRSYGDFLRSAKIVVAPVNREVVIHGKRQPGDEDTARTYELAAAHCFFLHQRTQLVKTIYDENLEVPLWDDAAELGALIRRWLPDVEGREAMAHRAHLRAVPAHSTWGRAAVVTARLAELLHARERHA